MKKIIIFSIVTFFSSMGFTEQSNPRLRAHKLSELSMNSYTANDVKAEIEFGRGLASRILSKYKMVDDKQLQKYVNYLGAGLSNHIGRGDLTYYFAVIDSSDVNAYACPGGYILLTKGLINILTNEAELVGVLAHEINHVNERHVIKKLKIKGSDDSSIASLGALMGSSTATFRVALKTLTDEAMNLLFNQGLMESEEIDSDRLAISALYSSGYDINAYRTLLEKIRQSLDSAQAVVLKKTHPKVDDRMKVVAEFESKKLVKYDKINSERFKQYAIK